MMSLNSYVANILFVCAYQEEKIPFAGVFVVRTNPSNRAATITKTLFPKNGHFFYQILGNARDENFPLLTICFAFLSFLLPRQNISLCSNKKWRHYAFNFQRPKKNGAIIFILLDHVSP